VRRSRLAAGRRRRPDGRPGPPVAGPVAGDSGTGLIATLAGVLVFLVFLLFTVQLLVDLYATSASTNAAFDGARMVAGSRADHGDSAAMQAIRSAAEARVRAELGTFGGSIELDWSGSNDDTVQLRIEGDTPRFLFPGFSGPLGADHIDRTVRVRVESFR
jgi:hypothetical protein